MERSERKFIGRTYPTPRYFVEFLRSNWVWGSVRTATYVHFVP